MPINPAKRVRLIRGKTSLEGTFGVMVFGREWCYSLELPWLKNIRRVSCIPEGDYVCNIVNSPKFGRTYAVLDVPDRSAILIHAANLAGSERHGYTTQLQGCIAPAERRGEMRNNAGNMQLSGINSKSAYRRLMAWADSQPFELSIRFENA
jgi:hypothetical protein